MYQRRHERTNTEDAPLQNGQTEEPEGIEMNNIPSEIPSTPDSTNSEETQTLQGASSPEEAILTDVKASNLNDEIAMEQEEERMAQQESMSIPTPTADGMNNSGFFRQTDRTTEVASATGEQPIGAIRTPDESMPEFSVQELVEEEDESVADFRRENSSNGFLKVQAYSGRGAIPVSGVHILVTKDLGGKEYVFVDDMTDESGFTAAKTLPAPNRELSQTPQKEGAPLPYTTYNLIAEREGFVTLIKKNLPIFPGVISLQPLEMLPVPKSQGPVAPIVEEEEEPNL